jgi:hypothetical protein
MKITDPDVIKNGEKDLIEALKEDLDLDVIKEVMQNKMNAETIASKGGEIVVHNNAIAFKLDFSLEISGSLIFDRQGNYIPESDETDNQEHQVTEDSDFEESLDINLPDYDLDDEPDQEEIKQDTDSNQDDTRPLEDIDTLSEELEHDFNIDLEQETDLESDSDIESAMENELENALGSESEFEPELEISQNDLSQNDMIDDDINDEDMDDILKESQDFWKLKKDE